jgi:hypothetical protein
MLPTILVKPVPGNGKERKPVAAELKKIYNGETAELAAKRLEDFE